MFGDKNNPKLIEKCSDALVEITKYIRDEDRGYHILTIVISKNILYYFIFLKISKLF